MSLFSMYATMPKLSGIIKVKKENSYGCFGMETDDVIQNFEEALAKINENLDLKGMRGKVFFCGFTNYEGKNFNIDIFHMFLF